MRNQRDQGRRTGGGRRRHPQAWAPYNFVPMPDKPLYAELRHTDNGENPIPQRHDEYTEGRHTGYFNVILTTETPLFVRGMLTVIEQEAGIEARKNPNAFSIDRQRPVIPGSSLRGMIRTLVEIVTNSKMHFVSDSHKMFFRAVAAERSDPLKEPYQRVIGSFSKHVCAGYLRLDKGSWFVQPARRIGRAAFGKVRDQNRDGTSPVADVQGLIRFNDPNYTVQYHAVNYEAREDRILRVCTPPLGEGAMGILVCTGNMAETQGENKRVNSPRTNYIVVATPDTNARRIPIPEQAIQDYIEGRSAFQKEVPFHKDYGMLVDGRPIFYIEEGGQVIHFGHTPNFRIAPLVIEGNKLRAVTPQDRIPRDLRQDNPHLDYAEALFGYVSEESHAPSAYAGRIFVTSAHVTQEQANYFDETIVPRILASPKPTTFQHYLEQPDGWQTSTHQLRHYGDGTQLRGHKLYWRQMIQSLQSVKEQDVSNTPETSTQHTIMKPVRAGIHFHFRLYFENLTEVELGALTWVLTFGGDTQARHQIGMGKPFGLGVVRLEAELVMTQRRDRYNRLFASDGRWFTAEWRVESDQQAALIAAFKEKIGNFENQQRIKELLTLVRMQEIKSRRFSYMQIEAEKGNDYQGRPVLPRPSDPYIED